MIKLSLLFSQTSTNLNLGYPENLKVVDGPKSYPWCIPSQTVNMLDSGWLTIWKVVISKLKGID